MMNPGPTHHHQHPPTPPQQHSNSTPAAPMATIETLSNVLKTFNDEEITTLEYKPKNVNDIMDAEVRERINYIYKGVFEQIKFEYDGDGEVFNEETRQYEDIEEYDINCIVEREWVNGEEDLMDIVHEQVDEFATRMTNDQYKLLTRYKDPLLVMYEYKEEYGELDLTGLNVDQKVDRMRRLVGYKIMEDLIMDGYETKMIKKDFGVEEILDLVSFVQDVRV